jgi:molybdopterin/thiamine biosynthesis adenylyltransferase
VIDCTDNIEARTVLSARCGVKGIPLLHGALAASGDYARIVWDAHFRPDAEEGDTTTTCIDGRHLPFFAAASSFLAVEVQNFLKTEAKRSWQLTPSGILRIA